MKSFAHWSIRYKLLGLFLLLGMATLAATGTIAYINSFRALKQGVTNQLAGVRRSKASRIENYYRIIHSHVLTLSEDHMFLDAMRQFRAAFDALNTESMSGDLKNAVTENYRTRFYPKMQALGIARPHVDDYLPVSPGAVRLQYEYIAKNPAGEGRDMMSSGDGSDYSRVHSKYHGAFRRIIEKFGYYDLYLVDDTGRGVYDVNKDRDVGTSLVNGPFRKSNLAKVVRSCLATTNPDAVFFSEFESYEASHGQPTQWVATPMFDGQKRLGVLALQLSTEAIDDIVTGHRGWQKDGLGQSGESVIIGPDYLLRSNLRRFIEQPQTFLSELHRDGVSQDKIERMRAYNTTILQLQARLPSVTAALNGAEGTVVESSLFSPGSSLVSYMPLNIEGLRWVVESQMSVEEALRPVTEMQRMVAWWGVALIVLTVIAALLITRQILQPVVALVGAARRIAAGDLGAEVKWKWNDELGMLSQTFNDMTRSIREKTKLIEQKNIENERLLQNILPGAIADRLKKGEQSIADAYAEVTVLFADVVGFTAFSAQTPATELVSLLNDLFSRFDAVSQKHGVEKIKTIGDCYMAACGLPNPRPDHASAIADMAVEMLRVLANFNQERGTNLQIRIGINSGPVVAGVIGSTKFIYDLWGDTVNLASRMESTGVAGAIHVTESVYQELRGQYMFEDRGLIDVKGKGKLHAWLLRQQAIEASVSAARIA